MSSPIEDRHKKAAEDEAISRQWHRMAGVGVEFIAAILLLGGVGWWVDWQFGFSPWGLLVGVALGFVVGLWQLIRVGMRSFKE
jgi:ATP synthase protein I